MRTLKQIVTVTELASFSCHDEKSGGVKVLWHVSKALWSERPRFMHSTRTNFIVVIVTLKFILVCHISHSNQHSLILQVFFVKLGQNATNSFHSK